MENKCRRGFKETGIYSITNKVNGKRYVGLSVSIRDRWHAHRYELKKGTHVNKHLQNAWNKYGSSSFKFSILERCSVGELESKELKWIDKFDTCGDGGYNFLYGVEDYRNINKKKNPSLNFEERRTIFAFNRYSGEYLGAFDTVLEVSRFYDLNQYNVKKVLDRVSTYLSAFEFIYEDEYISNNGKLYSELKREEEGRKGFYGINLMNGEYKHFFHYFDAATYFGIPKEQTIQLLLIEGTRRPVWNDYCFVDYSTFMSAGSVEYFIEKYSKLCFIEDCRELDAFEI